MYSTRSSGSGGFGGLVGGFPRDVLILTGIIFATFTLRILVAPVGLLALTPLAWQRGFLWQIVTYPWIGVGVPGFWFIVELIIMMMFGRDVYYNLGRRFFWRLLVGASVASGAIAVVVHLLMTLLGSVTPFAFGLMQGQHMLLAILIAAYATVNRRAQILLFFVLPVEARLFLVLEIVFAFMGFLSTGDFAGFIGITAAVGITYGWLSPGGIPRAIREPWLRLQTWWLKFKIDRMRKRRDFHVVRDDKDDWVN